MSVFATFDSEKKAIKSRDMLAGEVSAIYHHELDAFVYTKDSKQIQIRIQRLGNVGEKCSWQIIVEEIQKFKKPEGSLEGAKGGE